MEPELYTTCTCFTPSTGLMQVHRTHSTQGNVILLFFRRKEKQKRRRQTYKDLFSPILLSWQISFKVGISFPVISFQYTFPLQEENVSRIPFQTNPQIIQCAHEKRNQDWRSQYYEIGNPFDCNSIRNLWSRNKLRMN